jgi:hypothetical protein
MKYYPLLICIIGLAILAGGCMVNDLNELPPNKYVAIYEEIRDDGTIVSGSYPYPGGAQPPIPFFYRKSDYPSMGYPSDYPSMNDSLKILLGTYTVKESSVRLTNNLNVDGIYSLPYTLGSGITIIAVDKDGNVKMSYENESINLPPGTLWTSPSTPAWNETNTVRYPPPGIYTGADNGSDYTYTIQYVRTWTVGNMGIFEK